MLFGRVDILAKQPSIFRMKAGLLPVTMLFLLAAGRALAQPQGTDTSSPSASSKASLPVDHISQLLTQDPAAANSDLRLGKKLHLRGPLVSPFRGRKIADLPRRVLRLVNPFAATDQSGGQLQKTRDMNPRAWSSMVGINPGSSAFSDARTHESSLGLISLGR